jgi:hypothetical protein
MSGEVGARRPKRDKEPGLRFVVGLYDGEIGAQEDTVLGQGDRTSCRYRLALPDGAPK